MQKCHVWLIYNNLSRMNWISSSEIPPQAMLRGMASKAEHDAAACASFGTARTAADLYTSVAALKLDSFVVLREEEVLYEHAPTDEDQSEATEKLMLKEAAQAKMSEIQQLASLLISRHIKPVTVPK